MYLTIRKRLEAADKTMTQLAKELGVSAPTVSDWANGKKMPSADKLPSIASALGCKIDELYEKEATT